MHMRINKEEEMKISWRNKFQTFFIASPMAEPIFHLLPNIWFLSIAVEWTNFFLLYQVPQLNRALALRWVWHREIFCFFPSLLIETVSHFHKFPFVVQTLFVFSSIFAIVPSISEFSSRLLHKKSLRDSWKMKHNWKKCTLSCFSRKRKVFAPSVYRQLKRFSSELSLHCLYSPLFSHHQSSLGRRGELINYSRMKCWVESYDDTNIFSSLIHRTEKYRNFHGLTYILINFW